MTDEELAEFMGLARCGPVQRIMILATVTPAKRSLYNQMREFEGKIADYLARNPKAPLR